jgi:hypothetical protein
MQDVNPRSLPLDPNIKLTKTPLDEIHTVVPESVCSLYESCGYPPPPGQLHQT